MFRVWKDDQLIVMSKYNLQLRSIVFVALWIFTSGINPKELQGDVSCGESQSGDYLYDAPIPGLNGYQSRHRKRRSVIADEEKLWKDGKIPFTFDAGISGAGRRLIRKAMSHWENGTCVRFVERKEEIDYMLIYRGRGCCSHVGRLGGLQRLSLGTGCLRFGIIVHELGHAIGFYHEQNRPDRSSYIDILYNNVDRTKYANFDVKPENEVETFDQEYDYKSIMHYGAKFFSKNGYDTIRAKAFHSINPNSIGEAYYSFDGPVLSKQDILKANLLYKCSNSVAFGACGGSLSDDSGRLNIQGQFNPNSNGKTCVWIITPRKRNGSSGNNVTLTLSFDRFDVGVLDPETGSCRGAFVEIREGKGFLSPLISQFCGKSLPRRIISTSATLYLRLQVLPENTNQPIKIVATGHYKTNECARTFNTLHGVLQSPAFPRPYERNLDCIWHVKIPRGYKITIHFVTFLMHDFADDLVCSDYLDLFEGSLNGKQIGRFCGSQKPGPFFLSTNEAVLVMHSGQTDIGIRGLGFSAVYEAKDVDECKLKTHSCPHVCINYDRGYGCACHSGYYKVLLPDSADSTCIDADECQLSNGHCSHKCVNTAGSYFCACPTGYFLSANKKTCLDIDECTGTEQPCSQKCQNYAGGYRCTCKAGYLLEADGRTCIALPFCGGHITLPIGVIKSPVIPISYKGSFVCRWKINTGIDFSISLRIELPWVKNSECKNYLTLKQKQENGQRKKKINFCSSSDAGSDILVKGHSFVLEYHAQFPFQPRFQAKYHSVATTLKPCNQILNNTFDWFQSPGYPFRYPYNKDCKWTITSTKRGVTRLVFTDFELENHERCAFDYVEIEEHTVAKKTIKYIGKFCGKALPREIVATVGTSLLVTFHSDATVSQRGFRALVMKSM